MSAKIKGQPLIVQTSAENVNYNGGNVKDALDTLETSVNSKADKGWKVAVSNATTGANHALPTDYEELMIVVGTAIGRRLTIPITRGMLGSASVIFETGYYVNAQNCCGVGFNVSLTSINTNFMFENSGSMSAYSYTVFYR